MLKNSKLFSAIRFHIKAFKNHNEAIDELEQNKDMVILPVVIPLFTLIIFLLLLSPLPFIPTNLFIIIFILSTSILSYHSIMILVFLEKLKIRNRVREEEDKRIREAEYKKRQDEMYEDLFRRIQEERKRQREQQEFWERMRQQQRQQYRKDDYGYTYTKTQQSTVDQNMINAMKLMGLQKGFTEKDVKSAYRRLAKIHHPDKGGKEVNFKKLNTAYEYIMNRI